MKCFLIGLIAIAFGSGGIIGTMWLLSWVPYLLKWSKTRNMIDGLVIIAALAILGVIGMMIQGVGEFLCR